MSQLSNGSEPLRHSYAFAMVDVSQVGEARRFCQTLTESLPFEETRQGRSSIVINELGNNLVRYASEGQLILRALTENGRSGVEILALDRGPGMDTSSVMRDGFTTGSTPGTGLGAVRRLSDEFDVYSSPGQGTLLVSRIYASDEDAKKTMKFSVGAVSVPYKGEQYCGDGWSIIQNDDELCALVVDGLGHGLSAHKAAVEAIDVFEHESSRSPDQILKLVHGRLKSTRGGAVFLAALKPSQIDFVGAGNISASVRRLESSRPLISQNGTAGIQIRATQLRSEPWDSSGLLTFASDGIGTTWNLSNYPGLQNHHPSLVAGAIYRDFSRGTDDATVVVVKGAP